MKKLILLFAMALVMQSCYVTFVQSYCNENNIELYVITNEYTAAFAEIDNVKNPIFSMNISDCMINVENKLEDKFYKELFGNKYKKKFHIYYLENGEFVRTEDEMMNEKWKRNGNSFKLCAA